jgi:hypothetical protein
MKVDRQINETRRAEVYSVEYNHSVHKFIVRFVEDGMDRAVRMDADAIYRELGKTQGAEVEKFYNYLISQALGVELGSKTIFDKIKITEQK